MSNKVENKFLNELDEELIIKEYQEQYKLKENIDNLSNESQNENDSQNENESTSLNKYLTINTSVSSFSLDNLLNVQKRNERLKDLKTNFSSSDSLNEDKIILKTKDKSQLSFEIISAKTVTNIINNSKKVFICYTIIIKRSYGLETQPGIIERRYSDFLKFFISLKKTYPYYLEDFPFPKKIYSRNFIPEVITERSIAFQHLLSYCLTVKEIRESKEFLEFLLYLEFKESRNLLRNKCFEEAFIYLENLYFIIKKLYQLDNTDYLKINLFTTICALAACLNEIEKFEESLNFADKGFDLIKNSSFFHLNDLIVPFLLLSVQLNSRLSKCCLEQNKKLLELNEKGIIYDKRESLMELFILNNYFKINP